MAWSDHNDLEAKALQVIRLGLMSGTFNTLADCKPALMGELNICECEADRLFNKFLNGDLKEADNG